MMNQIDRETGEVAADDNRLRHWDSLSVTDPAHTKPFQRPGGFRGTAIRPVWNQYRLTMHFGPYGIGWGAGRPDFQVVPAGDELLVFCVLQCWYMDENGERAEIYGVGGDKVTTKRQSGVVTDDEAFKKAFTDALGNAFVKVGLSADVHMGMFEDSKYVDWARQQSEHRPEVEMPPNGEDAPARSRSVPRRQEAAVPSANADKARDGTKDLMAMIDRMSDPMSLTTFAEWPETKDLEAVLKAAVDDAARRETMSMLATRARKRREQLPGSLAPFGGA